MTLLNQDFGRQIVGGTAERVGLLSFIKYFCQPKISETNVAIVVHEDVLRLQVSVDNFLVVEVTNSHSHLDGVELGALLSESLSLAQVHEEFATAHEPHDEENLLLGHEHI